MGKPCILRYILMVRIWYLRLEIAIIDSLRRHLWLISDFSRGQTVFNKVRLMIFVSIHPHTRSPVQKPRTWTANMSKMRKNSSFPALFPPFPPFNIYVWICGSPAAWVLYKMVAHFTMRTYGVKQGFRFVEGIWLHRKSSRIRFLFRKRPMLHHTCA